jgi:hypothetical protein
MKITNCCLIFLLALLVSSCNTGNDDNKQGNSQKTTRDSINRLLPAKPVNPFAAVDISPMDMAYFPVDYPKLKMANHLLATKPYARVIYSRPHLEGRHIFKEVLKYGEHWRMGANEATEIELYSDAVIQGKKIKAGRYTLYCIPQPAEWTIVLNSNTDTWGLQQDSTKDVARFTVPVIETTNSLEYYTMVFEQSGSGANLLMAWDNVEVRLPIKF